MLEPTIIIACKVRLCGIVTNNLRVMERHYAFARTHQLSSPEIYATRSNRMLCDNRNRASGFDFPTPIASTAA
ncbi:hypothetical protein Pelo_19131 [Pelomyxa schiedti]|nr:hypothetical protein Pelo_19131 [Pelomyxa schiedti]